MRENMGMGMGMLDDEPFCHPSNAFFINQRSFNQAQPQGWWGPVIEEIPNDNEDQTFESKPASTESIVAEEGISSDVEAKLVNIKQQY